MGKVKRQDRRRSNHHDNPKYGKPTIIRRQHSQTTAQRTKKGASQLSKHGPPPIRAKVPFTKHDNILLVGEGDFSFSLSLKRYHKLGQITSTCFDSKDTLENKYSEVRNTLAQLQSPAVEKAGDSPLTEQDPKTNEEEWRSVSPSPSEPSAIQRNESREEKPKRPPVQILYGIDATKLSSAHKKVLRPYSPFTKIVFNFPHVGGLSTDVNRQVRYNQELLVGFFKAAKGLLSAPSRPAKLPLVEDKSDVGDDDISERSAHHDRAEPEAVNGQILVTLFEGEPYTLWNIRDLARHCGLRMMESFKFPWSAYPGYQHARTIGDVRTGKDRDDEGTRKGAWRGEERDARCYVLENQDAEEKAQQPWKKRRKHEDEEDDESDWTC
ncbi:uncharacterized protein Z518_01173 [Rhinocladiella mackenziei CBS 650.93]|uniref:Rhinocladiella mackenziei CBS 650.93 unplaced genomic scaffold supercont1.1, whole genome shotgun sequence n=1 Tax=Rhinocladiella mackenziei CBS 650.93 TaxID=1442369 RepID=A0A0D2G5I0_9EURO|nr:uncharacterized protein Z518_01173 [Rhinocladiella mackenziei CBS 650.93]KIX10092.1 hypothetical protein Z518_01173 [Rhinocladiella mackenziei CBS 650.93]